MVRTFGAFALLGGLVLGACGVGGDPESDNRDTQLGIVCNATFTTTGTFVAAAPAAPAGVTGCWPVGTWTFTAKVDTNECPTAPTTFPSYQFKVDRAVNTNPNNDIGYEESYTWLSADAKPLLHKLDVSEIATGCEGGVEIFSDDGLQFWNLKPFLNNGTLAGYGEYALYDSDQRMF